MSLPSDTELLGPSGAVTRLPSLGSPELSTEYLARIKEILEALLGRRGGNDWDRVVTFRDLHAMGLQGSGGGGGWTLLGADSSAIDTGAPGFQQFIGRVSDEIMRSAAFKVLKTRIGSAESNGHLPDEIRRQLQLGLQQVARERAADIETVEAKIQTTALSMASRLTEITAALEQTAAGVRQFDTAYADRTQAIALQVTQLVASIEGGGGGSIEIEERLQAIASEIDGLQGQWSIKIQTNDPANPVIAGIALAVEDPIAGPGTSSLIFMAEKFGFVTENGTTTPFVIVGDQIEFNGNVRINGQLVIGPDGLQPGFEAPDTKNSDLNESISSAAATANMDGSIRTPIGAVLDVTNSSSQGAIKIRLPQSWTFTMMKFTVDIFEYVDGYSCTLDIAGYNYGGEPTGAAWYNATARVMGGSNVEYPVRFGHDGVKCCVWIGNAGDSWAYPKIRVRDFLAGHSNATKALWETGWAISMDTSAATNVTAQVLDTYPAADWRKTVGPGRPDDFSTRGAPVNTPVGSHLAQDVESLAGAQAKADAAANWATSTAATYAQAQATLARTNAEAYADGIVTEEEARAIADATAKANAAQAAATAAAATDATAKANAAQAAAIAAANTGLAAKLNKNAADILTGPIALQANGALVVGTAAWSGAAPSGTGVVISPQGFAGVNNGKVGFTVNVSGEATFGGALSGATGNFAGNVVTGTGTSFRVELGPDDPTYAMWIGSGVKNDANAVFYIKRGGAGYFGGALSAGTLKTSVSNPSLAANAEIIDGPFGSNGRPINVVVGYDFVFSRKSTLHTYSAAGTPAAQSTVQLYLGATLIQTVTLNGSTTVTNNDAPEEESTARVAISGSFTYTDSSGSTADRTFRAVITNRQYPAINVATTKSGGVDSPDSYYQRLSITTTEQ